jgi:hypothetical protein
MKRLATLAVAGLLALSACGGDDSAATDTTGGTETTGGVDTTGGEETTPTTGAADTTVEDTTTEDTATEDTATEDTATGDTVLIENASDLPDECRALIVDVLKTIEPEVAAIDWATATTADLEGLTALDSLDEPFADAPDCDRYQPANDEDAFEVIAEIAADEAPGTLPFFEFILALSGSGEELAPADVTCDEAKTIITDLAAKYPTINDVPVAELTEVSPVLTALNTVCTPDELSTFFALPEITTFLGG